MTRAPKGLLDFADTQRDGHVKPRLVVQRAFAAGAGVGFEGRNSGHVESYLYAPTPSRMIEVNDIRAARF